MLKTVIEETREICTLCGGRGREMSYDYAFGGMLLTGTCRQCHGRGQVVTKTVTTREEVNPNELAEAIAELIPRHIKRSHWKLGGS